MRHLIRLIIAALRHPIIALRGLREFRDGSGLTFDDDPTSPRSTAYDSGREIGHLVTRRRYDDAA